MSNKIFYTPIFIKKAKDLKKKHPSLSEYLEKLQEQLINNPKQGADLGGGLFKVRDCP